MKSGAHDYISKDDLRRLLPAVERELREAAARREHRLAEEAERKRTEEFLQRTNRVLETTNERLHETQNQLLQSEKMASIGQLAAGVAHEINNPIGYVHSNLGTLEKYLREVFSVLAAYESAEASLAPEALSALRTLKQKADLEFLREDIGLLMSESKEGITRVKQIVQDLKDFSRVGAQDEWQWADLHQGIDSTLNIVNNELKYKAQVLKRYGELPEIECLPSQLNQVFLNLLVNAGHSIEERGTITIRSGMANENEVWIEIADTGKGIAPDHLGRIFDPFFTTKPVGKGTGLGLSLSYGIVQKHAGRIEVESTVGEGATFRIRLPVRHAGATQPAQLVKA
ncbi:MAG: ATPase [Betaproteobacteria bacterium]|nr:ATPase [Betaproteobacteria bacterium]